MAVLGDGELAASTFTVSDGSVDLFNTGEGFYDQDIPKLYLGRIYF